MEKIISSFKDELHNHGVWVNAVMASDVCRSVGDGVTIEVSVYDWDAFSRWSKIQLDEKANELGYTFIGKFTLFYGEFTSDVLTNIGELLEFNLESKVLLSQLRHFFAWVCYDLERRLPVWQPSAVPLV